MVLSGEDSSFWKVDFIAMETGRWSATRNLCHAPYLVIFHLSYQPSVFQMRPASLSKTCGIIILFSGGRLEG
jgi:hypothetical protein